MPIKQTTPMSDVEAEMLLEVERMRNDIIQTLHYVGQKAQNEAVNYPMGTYQDQTHHLRASTGYVVVVDGRVEDGTFGRGNSPSEGVAEGLAFAHSIARRYPKGIVLIMVAGKSYATYVADMGYNVLDSAVLLAERQVPIMLRKLGLR